MYFFKDWRLKWGDNKWWKKFLRWPISGTINFMNNLRDNFNRYLLLVVWINTIAIIITRSQINFFTTAITTIITIFFIVEYAIAQSITNPSMINIATFWFVTFRGQLIRDHIFTFFWHLSNKSIKSYILMKNKPF